MATPVSIWKFSGTVRADGSGWDRAVVDRFKQRGWTPKVFDVAAGELPDLSVRHHVLTGGATSPGGAPWPEPIYDHARRLVARCASGRSRAVGICLGSQVLASAVAGKLVCGPDAGEVEVGPVTVLGVGNSFGARVASFHVQQVDPTFLGVSGVELVATNRHTRVQAWRAGGVFGVQFRPEMDGVQLAAAVRCNPGWLPAGQVQTAARSAAAADIDAVGNFHKFVIGPLTGPTPPSARTQPGTRR